MMFDIREMILPAPAPAFEWRASGAGPMLVCVPLAGHAAHFFTTRHWSLGARRPSSDDLEPWCDVAHAADVPATHLVRVRQVHGRAVSVARLGGDLDTADIVMTDDPGLAIAVQVADCVPLVFVDARTGAVAAAHAGWRGLVAHVPETTVDAMVARFATRPEDLLVAAGPSIGSCCYEVGGEVRDAFVNAGFPSARVSAWFADAPHPSIDNPSMSGISLDRRVNHWFFSGWDAVQEQLQMAGVRSDRIFLARTCTASHPDTYCSYRRDGAPAGRMAAVIRCVPPRS
jgi:YfiH family protein